MTPEYSSRVCEVVWPWRKSPTGAKDDAAPSPGTVLVEVAIMAIVGLLLLFVFKKAALALFVSVLAGFVLVGGLWCLPLYKGFKRFGQWLAKAVGVGLSWLLLLPFFYICFVPARFFLLLARRDPMQRRMRAQTESYWSAHRPLPESESYHSQY